MNNNLLLILQSCDTIHQLNSEFKKRFGFLKFKEKRDCKKLTEQIVNSYESMINNDKWTIEYLYRLQNTLIAYYDKLKDYMEEVQIPEYDKSIPYNPKKFYTMYFIESNKNRMIILEIIDDNITFTVFDSNTGNSFAISSSREVTKSQSKVEVICKQKIIDLISNYLNETKISEEEKINNMIEKFQ